MLRKETVSSATLDLLKTLIKDDLLQDFFLVGGTALALQIGHRISIDIDLFSLVPFNEDEMLSELEEKYKFRLDYQSKNTLKGEIEGVKVDLVRHNYPLVKPLLLGEDVRMASIEDISAMKLNALAVNGTRVKDFIDIAYLSSQFTLSQMINSYEHKYETRNPTMIIKALDYHHDINFDEPIKMVDSDYQWRDIQERLKLMTLNPDQLFERISNSMGK